MSYFSRRYADVQLLDPIDEDDPGLLSFNVVETLEAYVPEHGGAIWLKLWHNSVCISYPQ